MTPDEGITRRRFLRRAGGVITLTVMSGCTRDQTARRSAATPTTRTASRASTAVAARGGATATLPSAAPTTGATATVVGATPTESGATPAEAATSGVETGTGTTGALVAQIRQVSRPLRTPADLDPLLQRIGDAHYVLLGEASHGTSEYYTWRARISQRLIEEKGFRFIAVEGDWPDLYLVNQYVKGQQGSARSAREVLNAYGPWPTWMWANEEVVGLVEWLRSYNEGKPEEKKAGFYGLDVYSLWESVMAAGKYLERVDPKAAPVAQRASKCFKPYSKDALEYASAAARGQAGCRDEAAALLRRLRDKATEYRKDDPEAFFNAEQNALIVKNAERYFSSVVEGDATSWNVRDHHMTDTLDRLVAHHGEGARAIVWQHNTHIGDARATDMARSGMVNVGQLVRERHGARDVVLVGFGSYRGTVIAADEWGEQAKRMMVPPAAEDSYEAAFHEAGKEDKLLILSGAAARGALMERRGHRAIGVVYDPAFEAYGNYVPTVLPRRYDAFLYIDESHALRPLHPERRSRSNLRLFPAGV